MTLVNPAASSPGSSPNTEGLALLAVFNSLPGAYLLLSPSLVIEAVSDLYLAHTCTRREVLVGQPLFAVFPDNPEVPEAQAVHNLRTSLLHVLATGQRHEMAPQRYDVPDPACTEQFGERHWQPVNTPVFDEAGRLRHLLHSVVNITNQVVAGEQLRMLQDSLEVAIEAAQLGTWHLDLTTDTSPRRSFRHDQLFGYNEPQQEWGEEIAQRHVLPEDRALFAAAFDRARTGGELAFEVRVQWPDASIHWLACCGRFFSDAAGRLVRGAGVVFDITARKHAEQELRDSHERLQRTNADLDNFVYTASHDLKAPITNIESLLYDLQAQLPAEVQRTHDVAEVLDLMQHAVARFQRTLGHLSDVAKLQKEYSQPATQVCLRPVVVEVCQDLQRLLTTTKAQLTLDVAPDLAVLFPAKNLRSVVYNLLSNALKYRHPDRAPQIRLAGRAEATDVVLTVQDNGLGIQHHQYEEVFALFQRLHTHVEGTGIGLYMVKKMVENAGGHISVASQPGVGTMFTVYFRR